MNIPTFEDCAHVAEERDRVTTYSLSQGDDGKYRATVFGGDMDHVTRYVFVLDGNTLTMESVDAEGV
jgi:hypothetical protein